MTETAAITGITEEQLETLIAGRWFDSVGGAPGWERKIAVEWIDGWGEPGTRRTMQWVYPAAGGEWMAHFDNERLYASSLEDALRWCDSRAEGNKIAPSGRSATRQEDRFARLAGNGSKTCGAGGGTHSANGS